VLFGLGSYAKTQIIPHVRRHLRLEAVHEIDPDQLSAAGLRGVTLLTRPGPGEAERYDAWFVSGFHHTHAAIAAHALSTGAYAVVEKPLATSRLDFDLLRDTMARSEEPRLFACFQKRYSVMDGWARRDLGVQYGEAVDMHCMVYEIPLPGLHWYNWPNSGSRLISNGCHWLDYFMHVNAFSPVRKAEARALRGSDVTVAVELENGAQGTMTLTDTGSERLGVRDVIDLRAGSVTVRMTDAARYEAESTSAVIRRAAANPLDAYGRMYSSICRRIVERGGGDSPESLRSTALMLDLEEQLPLTHLRPSRRMTRVIPA
jgi:predicted dehydrogenase